MEYDYQVGTAELAMNAPRFCQPLSQAICERLLTEYTANPKRP
jgi:hypothetical protein